jgi:shikimate dehydrogenase
MTDRYAVIGNPVEHSLSPEIHAAFAAQTQQDLSYQRVLGPIGSFAATCEQFFAEGGLGLNVTLPFKLDAHAWVQTRDGNAATAKAVNTIMHTNEGYRGYNTDGIGLLHDLEANVGVEVQGASVLILGAGGAVRGVLGPLLAAGPRNVTVANRTASKARGLAAEFQGIVGVGLEDVRSAFDIVINGTSAGVGRKAQTGAKAELEEHRGIVSASSVAGATCYDMFYSLDGPTPFCRWSEAHGARRSVDGLGMLVAQAAEAFAIWRGVTPDTGTVLRALRDRAPG